MAKNVLITGGAGFLGIHLAKKLHAAGYRVTLFDASIPKIETVPLGVTLVTGDIRNPKDVQHAVHGSNYVVHAAAILDSRVSTKLLFDVNVHGTQNVLEAALAQKVKRLIFISSTEAYGVFTHLPVTENIPLQPYSIYGQTKKAGEHLCIKYREKGLSVTILRPKTFIGPGRLGAFEPLFRAIRAHKPVFLLGSGNNPYQFLAVSDLVDAVASALKTRVNNETFNIAAKKFGSWRSDLGTVIRYGTSRSPIIGLPVISLLTLAVQLGIYRKRVLHYLSIASPSYVSIAKAETMLRWHPKKSNADILKESYQWSVTHT